MGMNPKENYLNCLQHKETEYTPVVAADCANIGFGIVSGPWFEKGPEGGGLDAFGIKWVCPASGGGAAMADTTILPPLNIDNFLHWRDIVKIPNVNDFDWDAVSAEEWKKCRYDPKMQALNYGCGNGIFERLATLMGFEDALMSLVEEPEEVQAFFEELTDYKIAIARKVKDYFHPDSFTNYDDIATEKGPFVSREAYRKLIKPYHKRLHNAVKELDMIPIQHTCGYFQDYIEDMIDTGVEGWTSVQPTNDIRKILQEYGDRITIMGGYDSNGKPARADASLEERFAEVQRCIDTYGKYDGFMLFIVVLVNSMDPAEKAAAMMPLIQEALRLRNRNRRIK
ncbi:MAG: hypothetical protein MJ092_00410 [Lachnospiraceae bacterium]|nr:hypothetical protein [Lachnospiraceae bacterium]